MCTQHELAAAVGISQPAIFKHVRRWGVDLRTMTLQQGIQMYVQDLMDAAQMRQGENDLRVELAKTEQLHRQLLQLQIEKQQSELINASEFRCQYAAMLDHFKQLALRLPDQIATACRAAGARVDPSDCDGIVQAFIRQCVELGPDFMPVRHSCQH